MGIKRIVDTSFWTDGKVDVFSPEDKYFMLYLLTNPFTTQLGIYEISIKQAAFQMGYSEDAVNVLLDRFENKYNILFFSKETNEIAIKNFLRHSILKGGAPVRDCLIKEIRKVKNKQLIINVFSHIKGSEDLNETVKKIIAEYEEKNGLLYYCNEKQNDNDKENDNENENENDNDVSYHDSYHDTCDVSLENQSLHINSSDIQEVVDRWNTLGLSKVTKIVAGTQRHKMLKKRIEDYGMESIVEAIEKIRQSDFLIGNNREGWTITFDWFIKPNNFPKVLGGNYDNKPAMQSNNKQSKKAEELDQFYTMTAKWAEGV